MRFAWLAALSFLGAIAFGSGAAAQAPSAPPPFYFGADLSFANEMDDCGAVFRVNGAPRDVYQIFRDTGHNLVRIRLWNNPTWTRYSNLEDVRRSIRRARAAGMQVLLDFHYSDDWADGEKQIIPAAWANIQSTEELSQALYQFTFDTLTALDRDGLMPDVVQVGNETNKEIMRSENAQGDINWARNAALLNAGIRAVRAAGAQSAIQPRVMLHIAQPENVEPWFQAAIAAGVTDFDLIGISYYRKWSTVGLEGLGQAINRLRFRYPHADVILVETAYPFTTGYADASPNVLGGPDTLMPGYPATAEGQARYMVDITQTVITNGGVGVVTWAPDWVSTDCRTRWGQGSNWENATFFDFTRQNNVLPGASFPQHDYRWLTPVTFRFEGAAATVDRLYLWADVFGSRQFVSPVVRDESGAFVFHTRLQAGQVVRFQIYDRLPLGAGLLAPTDPATRAVVAQVNQTETTLTYQLP
jgi:arabinogalactan endo-1,4-beta-galactosidase